MPAQTPSALKACLALAAILCTSSGAMADYFEWESWQDNASSRNGRAVRLALHVPETDNIRFLAACRPGASGGAVTALLGYNTGKRAENTPVTLDISSTGTASRYNGKVQGTQIEEGLAGIQISPAITDPFWLNLEEQPVLTYRIGQEPPVRLALTGSGTAVRKFVDGCKALLASASKAPKPPSPPAAATPVKAPPPGRGSLACKGSETLKSRESKIPVTITFINKSDEFRGITWIDFKGQPVDFASLDKGKTYAIKTYLSHIWMFTDGPGNCMEMFTPQPGMTRFEITTPSPAFGPGND